MMEVPVLAGVHNLDKRILVLLWIEAEWPVSAFVMCDPLFEILDGDLFVIEPRVIWTICLVLYTHIYIHIHICVCVRKVQVQLVS